MRNQTRRDFIKGIAALALVTGPGNSLYAEEKAQAVVRPNIVLILSDDIDAECLGIYGWTSYPAPRLPQIDLPVPNKLQKTDACAVTTGEILNEEVYM
jgi:hypothetical protein